MESHYSVCILNNEVTDNDDIIITNDQLFVIKFVRSTTRHYNLCTSRVHADGW